LNDPSVSLVPEGISDKKGEVDRKMIGLKISRAVPSSFLLLAIFVLCSHRDRLRVALFPRREGAETLQKAALTIYRICSILFNREGKCVRGFHKPE
jgi:hypothetical protein